MGLDGEAFLRVEVKGIRLVGSRQEAVDRKQEAGSRKRVQWGEYGITRGI